MAKCNITEKKHLLKENLCDFYKKEFLLIMLKINVHKHKF